MLLVLLLFFILLDLYFVDFEKFFFIHFNTVYSFEILLQFQLLLVVVDVVDRSINHMEARLHA